MPRVVSSSLLLVLGALLAICIVALYWCFYGTVNYKVNAQGIVFPFSDAIPVTVAFDGTVDHLSVTNGTSVATGDNLMQVRSSLATTSVTAPVEGVVLTTRIENEAFKMREPLAWLLPQEAQRHNREMLVYVNYASLRKLKTGQEVQVTPADLQREKWGYALGRVVWKAQYPTTHDEVVRRLKMTPLAAFVGNNDVVYEVRVVLDQDNGRLVWSRKKSEQLAMNIGTVCNIQVITQRKPVWKMLVGKVEDAVNTLKDK